jgi:hypothetical protein
MRAIETCRTAELGGHVDACTHCGGLEVSYNSCRNRHCPKCQSLAKARWLEARQNELLPVPYFHVVFTLPEQIAQIGLYNKRLIYNLLFKVTSQTLQTIGADPKHLGAGIGFLAILHTWGQTLTFHPHLHCIVPAGGFDSSGQQWISCRPRFFLPVRVLSRYFRRSFLVALRNAYRQGEIQFLGEIAHLSDPRHFTDHLKAVRRKEWVVYAKRPFGGPQKVLDYLGRYTHRVAIANHRITNVADGKVTFNWRDYRHQRRNQSMTLDAEEFIRRFLLHVLPLGFVRIRYFGFLANRNRTHNIERARRILEPESPHSITPDREQAPHPPTMDILVHRLCQSCRQGHLVRVETLPAKPRWRTTTHGTDTS